MTQLVQSSYGFPGLGGAFFRELSGDSANGELIKAIDWPAGHHA
ncbi:hypothetical protein [Streptomyces sindenensis]|uniref:Uncharacterized protein n=1 Tax=Streptomyces sindenensis TaxID=67363 RepID=A0ABW6EHQ7_9ACTN|nr:hypothetical protein [Streptomyces sindenensis]